MIVNTNLGVVLSGGGYRAAAQLGVLQFLSERNIIPSAISGASAGALVGAFVAAGYKPAEILQFGKVEKFFSFSHLLPKNSGLFDTLIVEKLIKKYIPHNSFGQLKMPLYVAVTDLTYGQSLIFTEGDLSLAIKASCAFPLVFQPVPLGDRYLCDGGVLNNFPIEQIKATCNKVIGINVNPLDSIPDLLTYRSIVARMIRITTSRIAKDAASACDVYLQPTGLGEFNTFDTGKIDFTYQLGYECARQHEVPLLKLKESLDSGK